MELFNQPEDDYYDGFQIATSGGGGPVFRDPKKNPGRIAIARKVIEGFARCLLENRTPEPSLEAALQVQRCLEVGQGTS